MQQGCCWHWAEREWTRSIPKIIRCSFRLNVCVQVFHHRHPNLGTLLTLEKFYQTVKAVTDETHNPGNGPGGLLGLSFAEYVPLASQKPYPIIL